MKHLFDFHCNGKKWRVVEVRSLHDKKTPLWGRCIYQGRTIKISRKENKTPTQIIRTILHEAYHAYCADVKHTEGNEERRAEIFERMMLEVFVGLSAVLSKRIGGK